MDYRQYLEYMRTSPMSVLPVLAAGLLVGFLVHIGTIGLQQYAFEPLFCPQDTSQYCSNSGQISSTLSTLIFHFLGLVALVRLGVTRPLLVVLASVVTLLGMYVWLDGLTWWVGALYSALLVGVSYIFYSWINRTSQFTVALGLTIAGVIIARLLLSYW